ncbi:MAG: DUF4097 family beta strand repeat-containing protein [Acidobacteriota bacterium]|nr:DUF4097 family beta strand repeat-containing protein [Acidobacteriota bacterium]
MISLLPLVFAAALAIESPAAQAAPQAPAPASDQTVDVARGTRLTVENQAGEVVMRVWNRDAVRVVARHGTRARVNLRQTDGVLFINNRGTLGAVDYEISVPSWMPVKVSGHYNYIELNGMGAEVTAENVRGDIEIKGGRGFVTAKSIEGSIKISGTQGKVTAITVNDDLTVENASGELIVESTNGNLTMTGIQASAVSAATVNGRIIYGGSLVDKGRYQFTTHNGRIELRIQQNPNATFYVRTYSGSFRQALSLKPQGEPRSGRRNTYIGGNGSAQVELESFNGSVRILGPGAPQDEHIKEKIYGHQQ